MMEWTAYHPEARYSAAWAIDRSGNRYEVPASGETVMCFLADGRSAIGWTVDDARANAESQSISNGIANCPVCGYMERPNGSSWRCPACYTEWSIPVRPSFF